jgi:GGDEF domain-containing protein
MYQFRKKQSTANINLAKLSQIPGEEDIHFLFSEAAKNRGRFVEIAWMKPEKPTLFVLTAKVIVDKPTIWMLYKGEGENSQLLWGHESGDLSLIYNLVMLECDKEYNTSSQIGANVNTGAKPDSNASAQSTTISDYQQPPSVSNDNVFPKPPIITNNAPLPNAANEVANTMSTLAAAANIASNAETSSTDLAGSLKNISVANLMRHIHQKMLTGRLSIYGGLGAAEIFFKSGIIIHASTLDTKGDTAVLDVITWREGEFHFALGEDTTHRSIEKNFETLFNECLILEKQISFLQAQGLTQDSYLQKIDLAITPAQFEQMLSGIVQIDIISQRKFFDAIDNRSALSDVLRKHPTVKSEWIPIMYSLLNAHLVTIAPKPIQDVSLGISETIQVDPGLIYNAVSSLSEPTTGIFSYGAFLYLLQREFYRFERSGGRFSIIVFELGVYDEKQGAYLRLSAQALNEACERIDKRKRKLDLLAHFQKSSLIMLLPETDSSGAYVFANRMYDMLNKAPLSPLMQGMQIMLSSGIASIPDDCRDLDTLLTYGTYAKRYSSIAHKPVILFSDIAKNT